MAKGIKNYNTLRLNRSQINIIFFKIIILFYQKHTFLSHKIHKNKTRIMEKRRLIWRLMAFMLFGILTAGLITFSSCSDDDDEEPEVTTLAGVYSMTEAITTTDIVDVEDSVVIPSGSNVTAIMAGGIFGSSPCDNPANSAIDMAEDGKLYFVCVGSESDKEGVDAGSWTESNDLSTLTLTLNSTVVPPTGFVLTVNNVTKTGAVISGSIAGVPMPNTLLNQVDGLEDIDFPIIQLVGANIEFTAVPEPF